MGPGQRHSGEVGGAWAEALRRKWVGPGQRRSGGSGWGLGRGAQGKWVGPGQRHFGEVGGAWAEALRGSGWGLGRGTQEEADKDDNDIRADFRLDTLQSGRARSHMHDFV